MIEGKVAAILNDREVALTCGASHGVREGMEFAIFEPAPTSIVDPDSGANLGTEQVEKIRVRIVRVNQQFSVGRTYQTYGGRRGAFSDYSTLFGDTPAKVRTLRAEDAVFTPLSEQESYVKRGDVARSIESQ